MIGYIGCYIIRIMAETNIRNICHYFGVWKLNTKKLRSIRFRPVCVSIDFYLLSLMEKLVVTLSLSLAHLVVCSITVLD